MNAEYTNTPSDRTFTADCIPVQVDLEIEELEERLAFSNGDGGGSTSSSSSSCDNDMT